MTRGSRHGIDRMEWKTRASEFASRGEARPNARLTEETVRDIRRNVHGLTAKQWSERLGVHIRTVEAVRSYRNWRHVA